MDLVCKVPLNRTGNWTNVAYKVEWFADGKSIKREERCGKVPAGGENTKPCPGSTVIAFFLYGRTEYKVGQWVSETEIFLIEGSIINLINHNSA